MGRGGSHVEPTDPAKTRPRVFHTERAAKIALNAWLKGKVVCNRGVYYDHERTPDYYEDTTIVPVPTRKRDEMTIVERVLDL